MYFIILAYVLQVPILIPSNPWELEYRPAHCKRQSAPRGSGLPHKRLHWRRHGTCGDQATDAHNRHERKLLITVDFDAGVVIELPTARAGAVYCADVPPVRMADLNASS